MLITFTGFSQTYKVDELRTYSWNETAMPADWQQDFTEQYTYANGGTKETKIVGISFPSLDNVSQHIKYYNGNNDIVKDELYAWDPTPPGSWTLISQIVYVYNVTTNNLISETTQTYNSFTMMFINSTRELYDDYDGANAKKQTNQTWNIGMDVWDNVEKVDVTYTSGMPTLALYSLWGDTGMGVMGWLPPYEQDTATYNGSLVDQVITENFDTGELDRSTYTYIGGLLDMILFESSMNAGVTWDPYDRELSTYDANDNNTVLIFEDNSTGPWVGYFKQEKDFSVAAPLSTESFERSNVKVYPNPVDDILNLKFKNLTSNLISVDLFGMDGRLLITDQINTSLNKLELDLTSVSQGQYILMLSDISGKNQNFKILKK